MMRVERARGKVFEFPETIAIKDEAGKAELDLPFFRCENCGAKWYDASDVVSLVLIYRLEFATAGAGRSRAAITDSVLALTRTWGWARIDTAS